MAAARSLAGGVLDPSGGGFGGGPYRLRTGGRAVCYRSRNVTRMGAFRILRAAGLAIGLVLVLGIASAQAFTRAITDDVWFTQPTPQAAQQWVSRTSAAGAKIALLEVDWVGIEPSAPPAGVDPTNPADSNYQFGYLDTRVREFAGSGISVGFLVGDAPSWAETPGGPADLEALGAWEPNPTAYQQVATALARRYSGSYTPAGETSPLPRVQYFQAWGEANFSVHLAPQWVMSGGKWVNEGPTIYRNLLNAFYTGVKSVNPSNFVITTGFGPYGDPSPGACSGGLAPNVGSGCRTDPVLFARALLCLQGNGLTPQSCPDPAHFDALAIDPYNVGSPTKSSGTIGDEKYDVSSPDLGRLTKVLNKAVSDGRAMPRAHKQLWVTEFGYPSNPPDTNGGYSLGTQARYLEQAFYLFWQQGVSVAVWYLVRDEAYTPSGLEYTGLYLFSGTPKPALTAYEFPLVVAATGKTQANVWGIAPQSGSVAVQMKKGRKWKTLFHVHASAGGVFVHKVKASLHGSFRASVGSQTSLVWTY